MRTRVSTKRPPVVIPLLQGVYTINQARGGNGDVQGSVVSATVPIEVCSGLHTSGKPASIQGSNLFTTETMAAQKKDSENDVDASSVLKSACVVPHKAAEAAAGRDPGKLWRMKRELY